MLKEKSIVVKLNKFSIRGSCVNGACYHCNHRDSLQIASRIVAHITSHPFVTRKCKFEKFLASNLRFRLCERLRALTLFVSCTWLLPNSAFSALASHKWLPLALPMSLPICRSPRIANISPFGEGTRSTKELVQGTASLSHHEDRKLIPLTISFKRGLSQDVTMMRLPRPRRLLSNISFSNWLSS